MPLDPYARCPCGSGKKLKFCCPDLTSEMEKIQKMLDGDQRAACLEHIRGLETKYPQRASLWGLQAMLEMQLGQTDDARATLDRFLEKHPGNPVGLAERAMLVAVTEGGRAAVAPMQDALSALDKFLPGRVFEAIGTVGHALLAQGEMFATRAHFMLCANIGGVDDKRAVEWLLRFNADTRIPVMIKEPPSMVAPPQGVAWQAACNEALRLASRGRWRDAVGQIEGAITSTGDVPELWRNLALLKGWLADTPGAVEALRKWISLDMPLDDAVEVEALAQLLDRGTENDDAENDTTVKDTEQVETVCISFVITDVEKAEAALAADARADRSGEDPATLVEEGEPRPRSVFHLLDRPLPETGVGIAREAIPHITARLLIFGRQTDREPQLELITARDERYDATRKILQDVMGDVLGSQVDEEVVSQTSRVNHAMGWSWRLPDDTPVEHQQELLKEQRHAAIFETWPKLALPDLGGRTIEETASDSNGPDSKGKIQALAAILLIEQTDTVEMSRFDMNELREKLGLPTADPIDPTGWNAGQVSLARATRLLADKLSDDALLNIYRRAAMLGARAAVRKLASEVVERESLKNRVDRAEAYGLLARCALDLDEEVTFVEHARDAATEAGESPAEWLLMLLTLLIERGDATEVQRLVTQIQADHMQEEGVPEAMLQVLYAAGIIDPGTGPLAERQQPAQQQPAIAVPSQAPSPGAPSPEAPSGKIWTPGGESGSQGQKSKIWTP